MGKCLLASSPVSLIFSMHVRKEGEPGIQNHVSDVGPYTRVGNVAILKLHVGEDEFNSRPLVAQSAKVE